jgi:hypothetical protein
LTTSEPIRFCCRPAGPGSAAGRSPCGTGRGSPAAPAAGRSRTRAAGRRRGTRGSAPDHRAAVLERHRRDRRLGRRPGRRRGCPRPGRDRVAGVAPVAVHRGAARQHEGGGEGQQQGTRDPAHRHTLGHSGTAGPS